MSREKNKRKNYQRGIQILVYNIIKSIEMVPGKRYITTREIIDEVKKYKEDLRKPDVQVRQAIYHLSLDKKLKGKRIESVESYKGRKLGWRVVDKERDKEELKT